MSTNHPIYCVVKLRPENLDGSSRVFDVPTGVFLLDGGAGADFWTEQRELFPGAVVAHIKRLANGAVNELTLYEVTASGPLNLLDTQPQEGDVVLTTIPSSLNLFQAGLAWTITSDGSASAHGAGIALAMVPMLTNDLAQGLGLLNERVNDLVESLQQIEEPPAEDPQPEV